MTYLSHLSLYELRARLKQALEFKDNQEAKRILRALKRRQGK